MLQNEQSPSPPLSTMLLNRTPVPWAAGCEALRALTSRRAVTAAGGLLLKGALAGEALLLNVEPNFVDGQRAYHYELALPPESGLALSGEVTPAGTVNLLFGPEALSADPALLRRTAATVARALVEGGLDGRLPLTPVARMGLVEVGAFDPAPATIGDLAMGRTPRRCSEGC